MTKIIIESQLDFTNYRKAMFALFYKKPIMLIITFLGAVMLIISLAYAIMVYKKIGHFPYIPLILGMIFVFLLPYSVYSQAKKHYAAKPRIKEKLTYTFDEEKISIVGESFNGKIFWNKIVRIQELNSCILIYQSQSAADIIPRNAFSDDNMLALKNLVNTMSQVKKEFKN